MHIEIKENQIIVEFSEKETTFIAEKVGDANLENVAKYVKGKLIKALSLDDLENSASLSVGRDFNLNKIKKVTAELKKRDNKTHKTAAPIDDSELNLVKDPFSTDMESNFESQGDADEGSEDISQIREEIGDELLAELLDENLLKDRQNPKKESKS